MTTTHPIALPSGPLATPDPYGVHAWADGHFVVDSHGRFCLQPGPLDTPPVPLQDVLDAATKQGASLPCVIRVPGVLTERSGRLQRAFDRALEDHAPTADYIPLYPVKVNPSRRVVETLLQTQGRFGLEVGTKAEMALALLQASDHPIHISVNGTKDASYLAMAAEAQALGCHPTVILESQQDISLVRDTADSQTLPLGVRLKPHTQASGRWADSGGPAAHFGFDLASLLRTTPTLAESTLLSRVQVLHMHAGSQITSLQSLKALAQEAAEAYVALRQAGWPLTTVNFGGGLAVDYDAQAGASDTSCDYDVTAYARTLVGTLADVCAVSGQPVPDVQTESGRYLTAHHALVVADATRNPDDRPANGDTQAPEGWTVHLSLFQSMPDAWALGMLFPVLPLDGIHDPMDHRPALLTDTTCDSDGRIKRYVTGYGPMAGMPMPVTPDGRRRLAFCLTGAYQEVLANAHNLFGRPTEVSVQTDHGRVNVTIDRPVQSVASILNNFGYDVKEAHDDPVTPYAQPTARKP